MLFLALWVGRIKSPSWRMFLTNVPQMVDILFHILVRVWYGPARLKCRRSVDLGAWSLKLRRNHVESCTAAMFFQDLR